MLLVHLGQAALERPHLARQAAVGGPELVDLGRVGLLLAAQVVPLAHEAVQHEGRCLRSGEGRQFES